MYHPHFGLAAEPFSLTPDPAFLFLGSQHGEALAAVEYGIREGRGFVTLVGEVGTGKTTVLYSLISRLAADASIAYVSTPAREFPDLLRSALKDFGVEAPSPGDRVALLEALNAHLMRMADAGRPAALVIDEAQNLSDETFEALRMLSNFETYTRKLIQIVLVGQPELAERLAQPRLRQLRERVSVRAVLDPLPRDEMLRYVAHRLERVGGTTQLFEPRALRLLVRRAEGIPRRANILCHNALLFAYGRQLDRVTMPVAREAVRELQGRRVRGSAAPFHRWWLAASGGAVAAAALLVGFAGRDEAVPGPGVAPPRVDPVPVAGAVARVEPAREAVDPALPPDQAAVEAVQPPPAAEPPPAPVDTAVAVPAGPVVAAESPPPPPPAAAAPAERQPVEILVPAGATLLRLARQVYGVAPDLRQHEQFFTAVRRLNPGLRNIDVIQPGERLLLPPAAGMPTARTEGRG